jgi:hypothetical protein
MIRRSGISTAQILHSMSMAIMNPGIWITHQDHAQKYAPEATKFHLSTARDFIERLGLNMEVKYNAKTKGLSFKSLNQGIKETIPLSRLDRSSIR